MSDTTPPMVHRRLEKTGGDGSEDGSWRTYAARSSSKIGGAATQAAAIESKPAGVWANQIEFSSPSLGHILSRNTRKQTEERKWFRAPIS